MPDLLDRYLASDVVVFASPLYVDNVTRLMKNFMDRLITTGDPHADTSAYVRAVNKLWDARLTKAVKANHRPKV